MEKIYYLTPNDEMQKVNCEEGTIQQITEGKPIFYFDVPEFLTPIKTVSFWCEKDAENIKGKVNAMATAISQTVVYGDVALIVEVPEQRGFYEPEDEEITECWLMEEILIRIKADLEEKGFLTGLHHDLDI